METSMVVEELRKGPESWNQWRKENAGLSINFHNCKLLDLDLRGADLQRVSFRESDLSGSNLTEANLSYTNLSDAKLRNCEMAETTFFKTELKNVDFSFSEISNVTFRDLTFAKTLFVNATVDKSEFIQCKLYHCDFSDSTLMDLHFQDTVLEEANFSKSQIYLDEQKKSKDLKIIKTKIKGSRVNLIGESFLFSECEVEGSIIQQSNVSGISLKATSFSNSRFTRCLFRRLNSEVIFFEQVEFFKCDMRGSNFGNRGKAEFIEVDFDECDLSHANLDRANMPGCSFNSIKLEKAKFRSTNLSSSKFLNCDFDGVLFWAANLIKSKMQGSTIYSTTSFFTSKTSEYPEEIKIKDLEISRYQAEQLLALGFQKVHLLDMKIRDDLATLRNSFSGIWGFMQIFALILFIFPYLWFVGSKLMQREVTKYEVLLQASQMPVAPAPTQPLLYQLLENIFNRPSIEVGIFILLIVINLSRLVLLWKTKKEEHLQEIKGLPSEFSFEPSLQPKWPWKWEFKNFFSTPFKKETWTKKRKLNLQKYWKSFYQINVALVWVNYLVVAIHTYIFLLQEFPV